MSHPPESLAELEAALTRLIRRAYLPTVGEARRRSAGVALERAAYVALVRTAELGSGRLSDVAERLGLDVSTASRHVKGLVDDGYVEAVPDPEDGRAKRLRVTPAGQEVLCRVRDARRQHLAEALADWDPDDVTALAAGLERLLLALDDDLRG